MPLIQKFLMPEQLKAFESKDSKCLQGKEWIEKRPMWLLIIFHLALTSLFYLISNFLFFDKFGWPRIDCQFDMEHYYNVKEFGYTWHENYQSNVAFFPGFPLLWRILGFGPVGMAALNILLYCVSLFLLNHWFKIGKVTILLVAALPSQFFMLVPYSESLYFFLTVILLYGIKQRNVALSVPGAIGSAFSRSAGTVLLPATVALAIINPQPKGKLLLIAVGLVVGTFLAMLIMHHDTNQWWGFMSTQKYWDHELSIPRLPLGTWGPELWVDMLSLAVSVGCMVVCVMALAGRFGLMKFPALSDELIYSLLCLAGLGLLSLIMKQGKLFSVNRYILCTPFVFLVFSSMERFSRGFMVKIGLGLIVFMILGHGFLHIRPIVSLTGAAVASIIWLDGLRGKSLGSLIPAYVIALSAQSYLFVQFAAYQWVG